MFNISNILRSRGDGESCNSGDPEEIGQAFALGVLFVRFHFLNALNNNIENTEHSHINYYASLFMWRFKYHVLSTITYQTKKTRFFEDVDS